jgi:transposase
MHLSYKTSKYKAKVYKSYSIAESYREGNTVKKRTIWSIGKLTDLQALQIRKICQIMSDPEKVLTSIEDIVVQKSKPYGDLAIANALWDEWKLSKAFTYNPTDSELSTDTVAKILTINRCVAPCSHYSIPQWVSKTAISEIIGQELKHLNDDKIYYELDKIDQNHENLEDLLFRLTYRNDKKSYDYINYDLSSSYFVGFKCNLSNYGKSKDDKPNNKQVVLGILVNDKGYPFKWDVYPGNMPEVNTLINNIDACTERFKLKNINMVFDRGIVSDDNLTYICDKELKFISALDKDQIPKIESIDLSVFDDITFDNFKNHLSKYGFKQYDDSLLYKDLGEINDRRYVLGFNPVLFKEDRKNRQQKIVYFENFLREKNNELKNAKRTRKRLSTQQCILNELKRLKIKKYFQDPNLSPIKIERKNKNGNTRIVDSFNITINKKDDIIAYWEKLDGTCVFISNHTEIANNSFCFSPEKIIMAYREKTKIEDAFKHIKSFLKIRPFFVNTDAHVRAVYNISVLAYFINKDLAERRKKIENIDYLNSKNLYEPFREYHYTTITDKTSGKSKSEPMQFTPKLKRYLTQLGLKVFNPTTTFEN